MGWYRATFQLSRGSPVCDRCPGFARFLPSYQGALSLWSGGDRLFSAELVVGLGLVSSVSSLSHSAHVSVLLCLFSQFFLWSLQKLFAPCARLWLGLREALSVGLQIVFRSCIIHCPGISGELSTVETSRSEALKPELGKSLVRAVVEGT